MNPEIGPSHQPTRESNSGQAASGDQPRPETAPGASSDQPNGTPPSQEAGPGAGRGASEALAFSEAQRIALQSREPGALETFFDVYFDPLYQYIWRMVGHTQLAEDLTQDTFMQIHRSLDRYDPARPLKPWVYTIATNLVRDHWRSRQHRDQSMREDWEDTHGRERLADEAPGPERTLEWSEAGDEVAQAVEQLPDTMRTTFVLRFYEGLSFREIADMVERNEVAVRKRFSRALEELRTRLAHLDPTGQGFLRDGRVQ